MVKMTRRAKDPNRLTKIELCAILNKLGVSRITVRSTKKEIIDEFKRNKKQIEARQKEAIMILKELDSVKSKDKEKKKVEKRKSEEPNKGKRGKKGTDKPINAAAIPNNDSNDLNTPGINKQNQLSESGLTDLLEKKQIEQVSAQSKKKPVRVSHHGLLSKSKATVKEEDPAKEVNVFSKRVEEKQTNKQVNLATKARLYIQNIYTRRMFLKGRYSKILIVGVTVGVIATMAAYTLSTQKGHAGGTGVIESAKKYLVNKMHLRKQEADAVQAKLNEIAMAKKKLEDTKKEIELKKKEAAEREAKQAAELKAKQESERRAKEAAELKAKQESERQAKEAAELKAKQESERQAKEAAAEKKAKEEADLKAKREDAERKAKQEAEKKAKQEEAEKKAKQEEASRKAKEEADLKAKREEAARKAKEEEEKKTKLNEVEEVAKQEVEQKLVPTNNNINDKENQNRSDKADISTDNKNSDLDHTNIEKKKKVFSNPLIHLKRAMGFLWNMFKITIVGLIVLFIVGSIVITVLRIMHLMRAKVEKYRSYIVERIHKKSKNALPADTIKELREQHPALSNMEWRMLCNRVLLDSNIRISKVLRGYKEEDAWIWIGDN
ncbi:hypothetical protein NEPAR04_1282 [Nematocida parisii]|nr:hypothetical protein NEPAR08_1271 [Nematocida parisii]KAI5128602.1 hypothetical protein NEPAR03_1409 [Nematocida parisii]KAI5141899.1 hypothetical protein NEPAR04_1282 [Nematocida parisii]